MRSIHFALMLAALLPAVPASALDLDVPGTHATLQAAVAAAAVSPDLDNLITISASPVVTSQTIDIGAAFGPTRRLVIRPADGLDRASIASTMPTVPILAFVNAGDVTLRSLDVLRNVTNGAHLITIGTSERIVIERCRIGSNSPTTGTSGWANVQIAYPTDITLRNNILFARAAGTFDHGIDANSFNDPANALRLYNNVVADHRTYGIRIDAVIAGPLVLLRNNVVANHPSLAPEPVAYRTQVTAGGPTVVSTHNSAFAGGAFVETGAFGTQSIIGATPPFIALPKASAAAAFVTTAWTQAPLWDANDDFFRLVPGGPLHTDADEYGHTSLAISPDFAVVDDIEGQARPSGAVLHTDRGADQIELVSRVSVGGASASRLRVTPARNPARGWAVVYETAAAGELAWQVFDPAGRLLHEGRRPVDADSRGVVAWPSAPQQVRGVVFHRVSLTSAAGARESRTGRTVIVP